MNIPADSQTIIEEKRILVEFELRLMKEKRERNRLCVDNLSDVGLGFAAILLYSSLLYYVIKTDDGPVFFIMMALNPFVFILMGMFTRLCRDTVAIRRELERRNENGA